MQRNMTTSLIHPSMVYACHSVGCHDICHSRLEERGERRHHSHRARCGSRQSSPIGKLRLASSYYRFCRSQVRRVGLYQSRDCGPGDHPTTTSVIGEIQLSRPDLHKALIAPSRDWKGTILRTRARIVRAGTIGKLKAPNEQIL